MSDFSTILLLPFILAFLIFAFRFYGRESASSMRNPSFLLALATVLTAGLYLYLHVSDTLPFYGTIVFAIIGLAYLGTAVARLFMI